MRKFQTKFRVMSVGALVALMFSAILPAYAAAATRPITFNMSIGEKCVYGLATDNAAVQLLWKSADGSRKAKATVPAGGSGGWWQYCSSDGDRVAIGDSIRASDGTVQHLLVVPELTLVINRVDDFFKGRAPAGDYVRLICGYVNGFEPCVASWKIKVNSQGKWGYNPSFEVAGWQEMYLRWKSDAGDSVGISARGPHVDLTIGSAVVRGSTRANALATVVLRRSGANDVVATAVKSANGMGLFQAKFRNTSGNLVKVRVGDRITSDVSPDEDWIVPNVTMHADAASDVATGTCTPETYIVQVTVMRDGYPDGTNTWVEDELGSFTAEFGQLDVIPGEPVTLTCILVGGGDLVSRIVKAQ